MFAIQEFIALVHAYVLMKLYSHARTSARMPVPHACRPDMPLASGREALAR